MFKLRVEEPEVIKLQLEDENVIKLNVSEQIVVIDGDDIERYSGSYVVDPDFDGQTLETRDKLMVDDVIVNPIEVSRVSNPSGGKTVYIGGII